MKLFKKNAVEKAAEVTEELKEESKNEEEKEMKAKKFNTKKVFGAIGGTIAGAALVGGIVLKILGGKDLDDEFESMKDSEDEFEEAENDFSEV